MELFVGHAYQLPSKLRENYLNDNLNFLGLIEVLL